MTKFRHEAELFKAPLKAGVDFCRLLVHDKLIAPMPESQVSEKTVRHRLAAWYAHQLPKGHRLL